MHPFNKTLLAATIASLCSVSSVYAETEKPSESEVELSINVTDTRDDELSTKQTLDADDIKDTPSSNGNLTDYLKDNPNVRFAGGDLDGLQGGEIKPSSISINGADPEQTAYLINGININNDIDPTGGLFDGSMAVNPNKSSEQAYYFDANLLSGITAYTSDIPAQFGGFTGGAVNAETRHYSGENRVKLRYRGTRSDWASVHIDDNVKAASDAKEPTGSEATYQPEYKKDSFSVVAEQAITDNVGMVLGFSRRDSDIKQTRLLNPTGKRDVEDHTRRSDNFLANFNWTPDTNRSLEFGLRLSDYSEGKYFATNTEGDVTDTHLAYGSTIKWTQRLGSGSFSATAAYDKFKDERDSSSNQANVYIEFDPSFEYYEGGYGDSDMTQQNINLMLAYDFDRVKLGSTSHVVSMGADYRKTDYKFNRDSDVTINTTMTWGGVEFAKTVDTLNAGSVDTDHQDYAAYIEDQIKIGNLKLRPGVRIDRDDFLENTNVAYRFASSLQVARDTNLRFGMNRYYGRSFGSMKLAGEILELNNDTTRDFASIENLKTPYSDEISLGVTQNVSNFVLSAGYVGRKYEDRIKAKDIGGVVTYRNTESYNVDVYTIQASNIKPWVLGPTYWTTTLAADWTTTDASNLGTGYNANELIYLDGKLMTRAEAQEEVNSNGEEWIVRLGLDMAIPNYNISWSNKVYIKAPVKDAEYSTDAADGKEMYYTYDHGTHTQWDTRVRYQPSFYGTHSAYVQVDVLNVLDDVRQKGIFSSASNATFSPGREFWLELGYEF
ncbi:TonB-dependent siderophore receptor [Vibrio sp. THAF190c]|uniref:TonB-dependent receptor plug domain-containing protein n=1 Tax=Vibrio sp. THAF190c TaxID=2587865 RepID=UPI0012681E2E|nr:TonB-dependent receptor [Vibrio sp. THAF190c]QFT10118.1 TonB-dependent Receptor Plug Domain protein [Vibrio sp. THAF190c]